ncbi:MAG: enolase C-terminal domain-like protein [Pseudomonadota bacterium]
MKIARVEVRPCEPAFFGDGYKMSFVTQKALNNRYVRLVLEDGSTGTGELSRSPVWPKAEQQTLEQPCLDALRGMELDDLPRLLADWRQEKRLTGVAFGVELAMLDLLARRAGVPVSTLLGGPGAGDAPECLSLGCMPPDVLAWTIRTKGRDIPVIQAKLSGENLDEDLARVDAALAALRPDQELLADFNGALSVPQAIDVVRTRPDPRLIWEETCDTYEENLAVARGARRQIMMDQCLTGPETFVRAIKDGGALAVVIKSDAIGGLTVGRTLRDMCEAAGVRYRIDGWWCGPVAAAGVLHLAAGAGPGLISVMELTDPIDTYKGHFHRSRPGRVGPVGAPGLGPVVDVFDHAGHVPA